MHNIFEQTVPFDFFLSEEEMEKLSLPRSVLPPVSRPLPDTPPFSNPLLMQKTLLEKAICKLYADLLGKNRAKVVIFTWVIGDGLGDFSAQIETAQALLLEGYDVSLISLHPERMSIPLFGQAVHERIPYQEDEQGTWSHIPLPSMSPLAVSLLKQADVILQLPTYFPYTREILHPFLQRSNPPPSYELIGEGGWGHTIRFDPESGARALGLRSWEKGLFFRKFSFAPEENYSDPFLQKAMEETKRARMSFGYLRHPKKVWSLFQTWILTEKTESNDLVFCAYPGHFLPELLRQNLDFLQKNGIKSLYIYDKNRFANLPVSPSGKTLSIILIDKLCREDYGKLLLRSEGPVGCRGDGSLAETLAGGKIPFFDLPAHKTGLLEGLLERVEITTTRKYLEKFFSDEQNPEELAVLLRAPDLSEGFSRLFAFFRYYYEASDFLTGITARAVWQRKIPETAFVEQRISGSSLSPFLTLQSIRDELFAMQKQYFSLLDET